MDYSCSSLEDFSHQMSSPIPPPPDHPPSLQQLVGCSSETAPDVPSPYLESLSLPLQPENTSSSRKSSALRWADLDCDSGSSDVELQAGLRFTSPTSAASTGVSTTDSPTKSPASARFACRLSTCEAGEVSGKGEPMRGSRKAQQPRQRAARSKRWSCKSSSYSQEQPVQIRYPRVKATEQGVVVSERAQAAETIKHALQITCKDGSMQGSQAGDTSHGHMIGKHSPELKCSSSQHFPCDITATPRPSNPESCQAPRNDSQTFEGTDTDESAPSDLQTDRTQIQDLEDSVEVLSRAQVETSKDTMNLRLLQSSSKDEALALATIHVSTAQGSSVAKESIGIAKKSCNRAPRVPKRKRPKAKHAPIVRTSLLDVCTQCMDRVQATVCYFCIAICIACTDASERVQRTGYNAMMDATARFHSFACRIYSSPLLSLLVLLAVAIYAGQWYSSCIANEALVKQAPHWGFRYHPTTNQQCDRCQVR